jgi:dTDP-4-amino-4,6-dideoxygalactose transaminase
MNAKAVSPELPVVEGGMPVRDDFLVFGSPFIGQEEIEEVVATLRSAWIGTGPRAHQFEEDFRAYEGARFAAAVSSCTAALHLSLLASGLGPGDEVVTSPMTFCATINAIIHAGARPVLADVDPRTMNLNPQEVERVLTPRTRAIIPVHFAGRSCDMDALGAIARSRRLKIIEDCAHAIETRYRGIPAGRFGLAGCFSFYATKNVVTGEGGMVITDDEDFASRIRILALHGMTKDAWKRYTDEGFKHYQVVRPGFKYNFTDMQAALGIHQLRRVEAGLKRREEIWRAYDAAFADLPCQTPAPPEPATVHARHLYTLLLNLEELRVNRDEILDALTRENIGVGVHYIAVHLHPYYRDAYGFQRGDFPAAEGISDRTVSLPLSPKLSDRDVEDVIRAVRRVLLYFKR